MSKLQNNIFVAYSPSTILKIFCILSEFMALKGNFFYKRLGDNICTARSQKKFSQEELGLLCDTDRTYIARIEEGKANPTIRALHKISRGLKIRLSKLLRGV